MGTSLQARPGLWGALSECSLSPLSVSFILKQHVVFCSFPASHTQVLSLKYCRCAPLYGRAPVICLICSALRRKGWDYASRNHVLGNSVRVVPAAEQWKPSYLCLKEALHISGWPGPQPTPLQPHFCCYPARGWSLQGVWASAHLMSEWGDVI